MSIKNKNRGMVAQASSKGRSRGAGRVNWRGVLLCPTSNVHPKKKNFQVLSIQIPQYNHRNCVHSLLTYDTTHMVHIFTSSTKKSSRLHKVQNNSMVNRRKWSIFSPNTVESNQTGKILPSDIFSLIFQGGQMMWVTLPSTRPKGI